MIYFNKKLLIFVDIQGNKMKNILSIIICLFSIFTFSQENDKEALMALKKANEYVYQGNELLNEDEFVLAEMEYRKAISEQVNNVAGAYNLGHAYYKKQSFNEALYRNQQAVENAVDKLEKHRAFHNIGNILMQSKQCKEAAEAFKNALRNNPTDDETRYNFALAKECAEQQQDQQDDQDKKDENKDEEKEDKENEEKEGDDKEEPKDEGDEEKKEGEDEKDEEGKPKDEEKDKGKGDKEKKEDQKPQQSKPKQMSPQQIKNLLEAMNNQEEKVQEKINAEKQKGVKIKTEKDW